MPSITFTTSTTWVSPFTGTLDNVECYGAGGNGANTDGVSGGGGGGSGAYGNALSSISVSLGQVCTVNVDSPGTTSGQVYFISTGNSFADSGQNASVGIGGSGGGSASGSGSTSGSNGGNSSAAAEGGGGGGAPGPSSAGSPGTDGTFGVPGAGGNGGGGNPGGGGGAGNGSGGPFPGNPYGGGGGGGGVVNPGAGGGATGAVILSWTYPTPNPTGITPNSGDVAGGTSITISDGGTHTFSTDCTVTVGGNPATSVVVVNDSTITCITPAGMIGPQDVVVTTADSAFSGTLVGGFTYSLPPPPPLHSQRWDALPDYNGQWWEQFRHQPIPVTYLPPPPLLNPQHSQRIESLPVFDSWWEQFRHQPKPITFIPNPPPTKQGSQRFDPLPEYNYQWWEEQRNPSLLSFYTSILATQGGRYRINNAIAGYNVYIGTGSLPNLAAAPAVFSATLPISIPLTPPVSGTKTFYILIQAQDSYGLQSQNQYYSTVTIDSTGGLVLNPLSSPANLSLIQQPGGYIMVMASYPAVDTDYTPATLWYIWVKSTLPVPGVDTPVLIVPVSGQFLGAVVGPETAGTWYVMVGLFRAADGSISPTIYNTVVVNGTPAEVDAIPSGWQLP